MRHQNEWRHQETWRQFVVVVWDTTKDPDNLRMLDGLIDKFQDDVGRIQDMLDRQQPERSQLHC